MEDATVYVTNVGMPTGNQRVVVVAAKRHSGAVPGVLSVMLAKWKLSLPQNVTAKRAIHAFRARKPLAE